MSRRRRPGSPEPTAGPHHPQSEVEVFEQRTLRERGLAHRPIVEEVDIRQALAAGRPGALADGIDLALLANSVYYVPVDADDLVRGCRYVVSVIFAVLPPLLRRPDVQAPATPQAGVPFPGFPLSGGGSGPNERP